MNFKKISAITSIALLAACTSCGSPSVDNSDVQESIPGSADAPSADAPSADVPSAGISESSDSIAAVDTDKFVQLPVREISVDLTYDRIPENICIYLLGDSHDDIQKAEFMVEHNARMVQVVVTHGTTGDILYDRTFSIDHVGEGTLAIVSDGKEYFLMESCCNEQQGYASYYGEVFNWKDGNKHIIDEFSAGFLISLDAVCRSMEAEDEITLREDAIPDFEESVQNWYWDSELLVSCDTVNLLNGVQSVYISLSENQYSLEDYFSSIWERKADKFITGTFDNIMGYSGFYVYDNTYAFPYGYFYALEDGMSLCIAENWGCSENDSYEVDINNDGENELICNVTYGDGAQATVIYYKNKGKIFRGFADDMLDHEYDDLGIASTYSQYLPGENVVEIHYWIEDLQDYKSDKYKIDLDKIIFDVFTPSV